MKQTQLKNCQECKKAISKSNVPYVLKCGDYLCESCINSYKQQNEEFQCQKCSKLVNVNLAIRQEQILEILGVTECDNSSIKYVCDKHKEKQNEIEFFCYYDSELCCSLCLLNQHLDHHYLVEQYLESDLSKDISKVVTELKNAETQIKDYVQKLQQISDKKIFLSTEIENNFKDLKKFLENPISSREALNQIKFLGGKAIQSDILKNSDEQTLLYSMINKKIKLTRIFSAKIDGFSAAKFHQLCDNRGPTLFLAESQNYMKFGGFTNISWHQNSCYSPSSESFLFSLSKKQKFKSLNNPYSIWSGSKYGPCFGDDIYMADQADTSLSYSQFGEGYELPANIEFKSNEAQSYLAGSYSFNVINYEIFLVEYL